MRIFGVILAGGAARRMGADKALLPLAGRPLVTWVSERLSPQVEALALSANGDPARFGFLNLTVLPDAGEQESGAPESGAPGSGMPASEASRSGGPGSAKPELGTPEHGEPEPGRPSANSHGPLSGILAGLLWARANGATALVSAPCDGPFLPPDLVPRLCLASEATGLALAGSGADLHPTYGLWPVTLAPALQAFLASGAKPRLRDFAFAHGAAVAVFPDNSFANANTPADLAALEARLT